MSSHTDLSEGMKSRFLSKTAKSPKHLILREIKRSQGLSVQELCKSVGLSYMGIKQHCVAMEKEGYLDTWRRPKGMGRPEKTYRLTSQAHELFPTEYGNLTCELLESIQQVYGPQASDKILFNIFKNEGDKFASKIKATTLEGKTRELVTLREAAGYMSEYYFDSYTSQHQIVDYNCPILICMDCFPIIRELECQMMERILGTKIHRDEERISGLYKSVFHLVENSVPASVA